VLTVDGGVAPISTPLSSAIWSLVAGRDGLIATGGWVATPGGALWWQSLDGRRWRPLPTYPPLGPTTCTGEGCGGQPNGTLVGDGHRMVALRGGVDAGVWTSFNGLAWRRLSVAGDLPSEQATQAVLLPGGVLLSDGTTTWFGEAQGRSRGTRRFQSGEHDGEGGPWVCPAADRLGDGPKSGCSGAPGGR
jgi:hypothetical protein